MHKARNCKQRLALLLALGLTLFQVPLTASATSENTPPDNASVEAQADGRTDKSGGFLFQWSNTLPKEETIYSAGSGTIIWTPNVTDNTVTSGKLTLNNATIENSSGMGIWMSVPLEITLEGSNKISSSSYGLYLSDSAGTIQEPMNLTITGSGSLEIDSQSTGIILPQDLTINGCQVSILFGSANNGGNGIYTTTGGSVIITDSNVDIKSRSSEIGHNNGAIHLQNTGNITIENSHVIVKNDVNAAMRALSGTIQFISSDIWVSGNTSTSNADGTLAYQNLVIDGGQLYAENKGSDLEIPLTPRTDERAKVLNNALLFCAGYQYVLPFTGSGIWYPGCTYDETAGIMPGTTAYILGDVTWNDNIPLPTKKITLGNYCDATLTIPSGVTLNIPSEMELDLAVNSTYQTTGKLINNGTLTVAGTIYNLYNTTASLGGYIENNGQLFLSPDATLQNQSQLNNNGTIDADGTFSTIHITGYNSVLNNSGTINGFEIQMMDSSYTNIAWGNTVIKSGQTLTLGSGVTARGGRTLQVPENAALTVESGAIIDARTNVTLETLSQYLQLTGTLTVNGELWLPDNLSDDTKAEILKNTDGSGSVKIGETSHYIVITDLNTGDPDSIQKQLVASGETAILPESPVRDGYRFDGWYISSTDGSLEAFEPDTAITKGSIITAKWFGTNDWIEPPSIDGWTYGDNPNAPSATPKYGADTLTYSYCDSSDGIFTEMIPEDAGTWYVKASVSETDDYSSLESDLVSFTILPKAYTENGDISISAISSAEDVDNIRITFGERILEEETDYEISVSPADDNDTVTVTITFKGNYSENAVITYKDHIINETWSTDDTNHWHECACGDIKTDIAEHTFNWTVITEATETDEGEEQGVCSACSFTVNRTIPVLEHTHNYGTEWKSDETSHWHECTSCGNKIDIAEHTFDWTVITEATETDEGEEQGVCSVCSFTVNRSIPVLNHTHSYSTEWKSDDTSHWHECACSETADSALHSFQWIMEAEPTDTEAGLQHEECTVCHYKKEAVSIPPTGSPEEETLTRVLISEGVPNIPETLAASGYDTEEKIVTALLQILVSNAEYTNENTAVYDVKLQVRTSTDADWEDATPENFPAEGLIVTLPYPNGTNRTDYDFIVTHMFTHDMNGYKAGDIETPAVEKTEEGLRFKVMGLSPVGVAWKAVTSDEHKHEFGEAWKFDDENHWHECSCNERADVAAHTFQWITDKEPTATEAGSKHEECTICGYQKDAVTIPAVAETPAPSETPDESQAPVPSETPAESEAPAPSETPDESQAPVPSETPTESEVPVPSETPDESQAPVPSETPTESETPVPSETPTESETPVPSETPAESETSAPSSPAASEQPSNTGTPQPEAASPKTNDESNLGFYFLLALLTGTGLIGMILYYKKNSTQ